MSKVVSITRFVIYSVPSELGRSKISTMLPVLTIPHTISARQELIYVPSGRCLAFLFPDFVVVRNNHINT